MISNDPNIISQKISWQCTIQPFKRKPVQKALSLLWCNDVIYYRRYKNITKVKCCLIMNKNMFYVSYSGLRQRRMIKYCKYLWEFETVAKSFFVFDGIEFCKHSVLENLVRLCITLTRFSVILIAK